MTHGLGQWIQSKRAEKGWTQMELARRIDSQTSSVSRWERGEVDPNVGMLRRLCAAFDASADDALRLKAS